MVPDSSAAAGRVKRGWEQKVFCHDLVSSRHGDQHPLDCWLEMYPLTIQPHKLTGWSTGNHSDHIPEILGTA